MDLSSQVLSTRRLDTTQLACGHDQVVVGSAAATPRSEERKLERDLPVADQSRRRIGRPDSVYRLYLFEGWTGLANIIGSAGIQ